MRQCIARSSTAPFRRQWTQELALLGNSHTHTARGIFVAGQRFASDSAPSKPSDGSKPVTIRPRPSLRDGVFKSGQHLAKRTSEPRTQTLQRTARPRDSNSSSSGPPRQTSPMRPPRDRSAAPGRPGAPRGNRGPGGGARGGMRERRERSDRPARGSQGSKSDKAAEENAGPESDMLSNEEVGYLLEEQHRRQHEVPFEPIELDKNELLGMGGGTLAASVGHGGVELLEERLRAAAKRVGNDPVAGPQALVNRLLRGELVKFKDDSEKAAVLNAVNARITARNDAIFEEKGERVEKPVTEFGPVSKEVRARAEKALIQGKYELTLPAGKTDKDKMKNVALANLQKNGSYIGGDMEKFMAKFKSLM